MNNVLALQALATAQGAELLGISSVSNHCSSASNGCQTQEL
ncbi:class III lanthipeptide [Xanthomonas arboricola]|nr:class III lanthipeptide [Xanthomonas arboricola]